MNLACLPLVQGQLEIKLFHQGSGLLLSLLVALQLHLPHDVVVLDVWLGLLQSLKSILRRLLKHVALRLILQQLLRLGLSFPVTILIRFLA